MTWYNSVLDSSYICLEHFNVKGKILTYEKGNSKQKHIRYCLQILVLINVIKFFLLQEQDKKKKNKKKIVIKAERDNDFGDLAAASTGGYDDFFDDDFI